MRKKEERKKEEEKERRKERKKDENSGRYFFLIRNGESRNFLMDIAIRNNCSFQRENASSLSRSFIVFSHRATGLPSILLQR